MTQRLTQILMCAVALVFAVPLLWTLVTALKSDAQLVVAAGLLPHPLTPENFPRALQVVPMLRFTLNTAALALACSAAHLFSCPLAAYALARLRCRPSGGLRLLTLAAFVMPFPAIMVPQYLLFHKLGWVNSYLPLVVPSLLGNPMFILYLTNVFSHFPRELEEAAVLEGASPWQVLYFVVMPLSSPALAAVVALTIQSVWNDFLTPLLYLQDQRLYTVNLGLQFYRSSHHISWNLMMAATSIAVIPVLLLFLLAQKAFISDPTQGSER